VIIVHSPSFGFHQLLARILQVVNCIDAMAAEIALIVLKLVDRTVEAVVNECEIAIARAIRARFGGRAHHKTG
jgi:hypothetical protein